MTKQFISFTTRNGNEITVHVDGLEITKMKDEKEDFVIEAAHDVYRVPMEQYDSVLNQLEE